MSTKQDLRQSLYRGLLDQLATVTNQTADHLISAANAQLTPLLRMSATSTPSLVVNIEGGDLTDSETNRRRAIPHIGTSYVQFSSGTVTFPATSGGNIVCSPGNNTVLTISASNYAAVLVYLDSSGNLNTLVGVDDPVEANAIANLPVAPGGTLAIGYVVVHDTSGTIDVVSQDKIAQFGTGTGSGGSTNIKARLYDKTLTTLPSGTSATIDGVSVANNDLVLFANLSANNNKIYKVTGVGTSLVWTPQSLFSSISSPTAGDTVRVTAGNSFAGQNAVFSGTNWSINESIRLFDASSPSNYMEEIYVHSIALAAGQTGTAIASLTFSATTYASLDITIQVKEATTNLTSLKTIKVVYDGTNVAFSSSGSTTGALGISFDADVSGGNIRILYSSGANTGTARAWVKKFLA